MTLPAPGESPRYLHVDTRESTQGQDLGDDGCAVDRRRRVGHGHDGAVTAQRRCPCSCGDGLSLFPTWLSQMRVEIDKPWPY